MDKFKTVHSIATETIISFAHSVNENNLELNEALLALETFVTGTVFLLAQRNGQPDLLKYVSEILDLMTENAMKRINDLLERGFPP